MKIFQTWKRNMPDSISGESITLTIIYSSFDKNEIDELESRMPKGMIFASDEKGNQYAHNKTREEC